MLVAAAWNESAATLSEYADKNGHEWVFGEGPPGLAQQYSVFSQASKVGIAADGVIALRGAAGRSGDSYWREVFEQLQG